MKKRLMALDYGEKRIGVAISDALGITAQPKPFIPNTDQRIKHIQALVDEYDIETIFLGLPKHTRGGETKTSEEIRTFGDLLKKETQRPVTLLDERFSTVAATKQLDQAGFNRKKQRQKIDSQAAAFILQGILDKST